MPLRDKNGLARAKAIMKYTDSESNELMIGALVEIKLNTIDNEFIRPTKEKPTQTTGSR